LNYRRVLSSLISLCLVFIGVREAKCDDFRLPIIVRDNSGVNRTMWPARGGIPLPAGLLQEDEVPKLCVIDTKGNTVPSQFDPFVLWWGKDRSVKWLLVDILANVSRNGETIYSLVKCERSPRSELKVLESDKTVEVVTGPLKAVISKERGTILESVFLDIDRDTEFSRSERMIKPDELNGSNVTSDDQEIVYGEIGGFNMWGSGSGRIREYKHLGTLIRHRYSSGVGKPDRVIVEARGPVRASVRIEGKHWPGKKDAGICEEGFYYYTTWLHFYAGKSFIEIEHCLDNNRKDYPLHIYRIKDLSLGFSLDKWSQDGSRFRFGGDRKDTAGKLQNSYVSLLQDSANLERWDLSRKLKGKSGKELKKVPGYFHQSKWKIGPAAFRGYKVVTDRTWPTDGKILDKGDHAPGWGDISTVERGLSIYVSYFWEECPKGLRFKVDRMEAVLFPDFSPEVFHIHSSARKSHKITLFFHKTDAEAGKSKKLFKSFRYPMVIWSGGPSYVRSLAWPRLLGLPKGLPRPNHEHWYPQFRWSKKLITARWKTQGLSTGFNQGGMHDNYWSRFYIFLQTGSLNAWETAIVYAKWASEWIPWLIHGYNLSPDDTKTQDLIVGYGPKKVYTHRNATQVEGWVTPFNSNALAFSTPAKSHLDGEHLIHMWPFEWYYLSGSPIAYDALLAVGNMAKYSVHRNFFKSTPKYHGKLHAPSLEEIFYFDDKKYPKRRPWYFFTRVYSSHLLSLAWTYAAIGDPHSLFYAKWLVRRLLYLQRKNGGPVGEKPRWNNIPPWQDAENAIAAFELYREIGDEELLDIMGSWLEWAYAEAYSPEKGMPHRFKRGTKPKKFEHHWYPGSAAAMCYVAFGDPKALAIAKEWASVGLPHIRAGKYISHPAGQSAGYVLTYLEKAKRDKTPPEPIRDLKVGQVDKDALILKWTAPKDTGKGSAGNVRRYWVKYSDLPIVDHPKFPDELGKKIGFYQADNLKGEPIPSKNGEKEIFTVEEIAPHDAYGAKRKFGIKDLKPGRYYFAVKSWDEAGNISPISNVAEVEINSLSFHPRFRDVGQTGKE